jgi:[3-methyl-2-oxobutanoate dehydrogenase (acetyl-transferring)] kinase
MAKRFWSCGHLKQIKLFNQLNVSNTSIGAVATNTVANNSYSTKKTGNNSAGNADDANSTALANRAFKQRQQRYSMIAEAFSPSSSHQNQQIQQPHLQHSSASEAPSSTKMVSTQESANSATTPPASSPSDASRSSKSDNSMKNKSNLSESRERSTNMRFFYSDVEIDRAMEKPLVRLNPMTMMYMGYSNDNSHLNQSANYLRHEMPIRLAHMIKELRHLPFIVACNPSILEIHERCIKAFRSFDDFEKDIKDSKSEKSFNDIVQDMLNMNKDILVLLCDGFKESRRYVKNEEFIRSNLNKILSARLGIRLLCEHHIALNRQSKIIKPNSDSSNEDECSLSHQPHSSSAESDNQQGKEESNTNGSGEPNKDEWVGVLHKKFSPKRIVETSTKIVTRLSMEKYNAAPKVKIDGHTSVKFPYIPLPLEYILPELLKNSFRATCEHHKDSSQLPDVNVTIALNERDFIIRIRDRGGGIPHNIVNKVFDYHFTTVEGLNEPFEGDSHTRAHELNSSKAPPIDFSPIGMICEASSSRGLAVMHGYGFGLPTSRAYAEYLSGSLTFQSMQGIGTDFYLRYVNSFTQLSFSLFFLLLLLYEYYLFDFH